jgi:glycosyltransferase involved in cell wall biosynthesis
VKKQIHVICPYPPGQAPSQRFRFEQYIPVWEEKGFEVCIHSFHTIKSWSRLYKSGAFFQKSVDMLFNLLRCWKTLFIVSRAQNIFIHREIAQIGPPVMEWLLVKLFRRNYIFDFDDAVWVPNVSESNEKFQKLKCFWKTKYLIKWAKEVNAGNDFLKTYALGFNPNTNLIPTTIDLKNQHTHLCNHNEDNIVIGWTGTHSTMRYLDFIVPIIAELEKTFSFEFRVICNQKPTYNLNSMKFVPWNKHTEMHDLSKIHIGIMPLVADQWSEGKCGFKALQYMAQGSVAIVSPVGVNSQIVQNNQTGFIANSMEDWKNTLTILLKQSETRKLVGANAKKSIEQKWSVDTWKKVYWNMYS